MESISQSGLVDQVFLRCVEDCFEPIMLTDKFGKLKYVNPAWCLTYGYTKQEALGETPRLLRSSFQPDDFYHSMWKTIMNPEIGFWRGEVINRAKDGHHVPVLLTITPHRSISGEIEGYMGIAIDLSEQKKMELQILQQDRLASIGMLAGGLAHEIGNPLGVMRGRAEFVLDQVKGNSSAEKNIETILSQIDRISGLIQSLLNFTRAPSKILLRPVKLSDSIDQVVFLMKEACRVLNITLSVEAGDCLVMADASQLQQVLLNLVLNSMHAIEEQLAKHPEKKSGNIKIYIQKNSENKCAVKIKDDGCGIAAANIQKLFQPFFSTKPAGKGTGLGLAIVSKLVDEMSGTIKVESDGVGLGATFILTFQEASSEESSCGSSSFS